MTPPITSTTTTTVTDDPSASDPSTVVAADAPADPEGEAAEEESAPERPAFSNSLYPRIALEGGVTFTDLSNRRTLFTDHVGGYGRAEGGIEYSLSPDVFLQVNAGLSYGSVSMGLGEGVSSSHDYFGIFANGRLGTSLFGGNLRFHGGLDLGTVHVGASECADGVSCGAVFTRNAQLLPIDRWAFMIAGEAGVSTLQGGLGIYARLGAMAGVNPGYDVIDAPEENPDFGLNIPFFQLGLQAEIFSLIRAITGSSSAEPDEADGEDAEADADEISDAGASEEGAPEAPAETPTGIALIRQRQTDVAEYVSQATQAGVLVTAARAAYTAVSGSNAEANRDRRVQVLEAVNQARAAATAVTHIAELIAEATAAREQLTDRAERTEARSAIRDMERQLGDARSEASRIYREVQSLVTEFNGRDPGEDITMDFADPVPRRRRRRTPDADAEAPPETRREPAPPPPETGEVAAPDPSIDLEAGE